MSMFEKNNLFCWAVISVIVAVCLQNWVGICSKQKCDVDMGAMSEASVAFITMAGVFAVLVGLLKVLGMFGLVKGGGKVHTY